MSDCPECTRLKGVYEEATALRMKAEAELTAVTFERNRAAIKIARGAVMAAVVRWSRAHDALRRHESSHVMKAGGG